MVEEDLGPTAEERRKGSPSWVRLRSRSRDVNFRDSGDPGGWGMIIGFGGLKMALRGWMRTASGPSGLDIDP